MKNENVNHDQQVQSKPTNKTKLKLMWKGFTALIRLFNFICWLLSIFDGSGE
ncbi:hypothetical protein AB6C66_21895 [Vibrio splendidus]|uniref:hypothetical protein n=1 Tax=Vibrio TaxID=662 RepID=UPI0002EB31C2|nr:hypothetical protein [Vibrio splendidus]